MNAGIFGAISGRKEPRVGKIQGLQPIWESVDSGVMTLAGITFVHGLGFTPKLYSLGIRCIATNGLPIGTETETFIGSDAISGLFAAQKYVSSSNMGWVGVDTSWNVLTGPTAALFAIGLSSWRPFARIFG